MNDRIYRLAICLPNLPEQLLFTAFAKEEHRLTDTIKELFKVGAHIQLETHHLSTGHIASRKIEYNQLSHT